MIGFQYDNLNGIVDKIKVGLTKMNSFLRVSSRKKNLSQKITGLPLLLQWPRKYDIGRFK